MGADAWERCPICHNRPEEHPDGIACLYGLIPLEEFEKLREELIDLEAVETVREDYEIGLNEDGTAYVQLYFKCQTCGAEWTLEQCIDASVKDSQNGD